MPSAISFFKSLAALPGTLINNAIYMVKRGNGFDLYGTNATGNPVAIPLNPTPAGNDGQVQYRNGNDVSGATNVNIGTNGNLNLVTQDTQPPTPNSGTVTIWPRRFANRESIALLESNGVARHMQSSDISFQTMRMAFPGSNASPVAYGFTLTMYSSYWGTPVGTFSATTFDGVYELYTGAPLRATTRPRAHSKTAGTAGSLAWALTSVPLYYHSTPQPSAKGGFYVHWRFHREDPSSNIVPTARIFIGCRLTANNPTNVEPSTQLNVFGLVKDSADTNLFLFYAGASSGVKVDLGPTFAIHNNSYLYDFALYSPAGSGKIYYQLTNVLSGDTTSGEIPGSGLPTAATVWTPCWWVGNGTTANYAVLSVVNFYAEIYK